MNTALELMVYRNLLGTFPYYVPVIRKGVVEEVSERKRGWNDAHRSLSRRIQAFRTFLESFSEEEQTFLVKLQGQVGLEFNEADASVNLYVDCSDVFCWGASDSEECTQQDIPDLQEVYAKTGNLDLWVARRRQMQPQEALKTMMIESGSWTPEWEALPENPVTILEREEKE